MIDTNSLLSIAFSLISGFTNVVSVVPSEAPQQPQDVERFVVGLPGSPVAIYLVNRAGAEYWIDDGIVCGFASPESFFRLQDPSLVGKFAGTARFSSNDVVNIAEKALRALVKTGDPLNDGTPIVQMAGIHRGARIPFFRITWPKKTRGSTIAARVEVDARTGRIVDLHLFSPCFYDKRVEKDIKERVHAPDVAKANGGGLKPVGYSPSTNLVLAALKGWAAYCHKFGLQYADASIDDINWEDTFLFSPGQILSNGERIPITPICHIVLKNRAFFDSVNGVVFGASCWDAAFPENGTVRSYADWSNFEGSATNAWFSYAKIFENRLSSLTDLPASFFTEVSPTIISPTEIRPGHPLKRALVSWHRLPTDPADSPEMQRMKSIITAEFDLETGEIKRLQFLHPQLADELLKRVFAETR